MAPQLRTGLRSSLRFLLLLLLLLAPALERVHAVAVPLSQRIVLALELVAVRVLHAGPGGGDGER